MRHWSYATLVLAFVWFAHPVAIAQEATTPPVTPADESQVTAIAPMVIVDQRGERVRRNFALSGNMFDCANAIWNLGDDRVAADRLTRLEATVRGAMGPAASGQQLIVERYNVYFNGRAYVERVSTENAGLIGAVMSTRQPDPAVPAPTLQAKCSEDRMPEGWFATSEITNNFSPVVVQITIRVGEARYTVRAAHSPPAEMWDEFSRRSVRPALAAEVELAIDQAHRALALQVSAPAE